MSQSGNLRTPHPLSGSTLRNWLRILWRYGGEIDPSYWGRAAKITAWSLFGIPSATLESVIHGRRVAEAQINTTPIMVLGHWRSGTTNMHNLLTTDPQFASLSLLQCAIPNIYLTLRRPLSWYLRRKLPKNRPMDAVRLSLDEPMSEDFGLVGTSPRTHYLSYFFPRQAEDIFRETVLFDGVDDAEEEAEAFKHDYLRMLKKASYASGGRQLVLKNPPNIGRMRQVLEMFPDVKIVSVQRNPYVVHASTMRMMERFLEKFALQKYDMREVERFVSVRYQLIMKQWLKDKALIPEHNLIEVRHEDVIGDQMNIVESIYHRFDIPGWGEQAPRLQAYVDGLSGYQNNEYAYDPSYVDRIRPYVQFMADEWGYEAPDAVPTAPSAAAIV